MQHENVSEDARMWLLPQQVQTEPLKAAGVPCCTAQGMLERAPYNRRKSMQISQMHGLPGLTPDQGPLLISYKPLSPGRRGGRGPQHTLLVAPRLCCSTFFPMQAH